MRARSDATTGREMKARSAGIVGLAAVAALLGAGALLAGATAQPAAQKEFKPTILGAGAVPPKAPTAARAAQLRREMVKVFRTSAKGQAKSSGGSKTLPKTPLKLDGSARGGFLDVDEKKWAGKNGPYYNTLPKSRHWDTEF